MNFANCNLCYPKLKASPSYGDAIRYHAESESNENGLGINCYGDEFKEYLADGTLRVDVDWGASHLNVVQQLIDTCCSPGGDSTFTLRAQITVHGIGRRPAMALLGSNAVQINVSLQNDNNNAADLFPPFSIKWRHDEGDDALQLYPEYLVKFQMSHYESMDHGLTRHLHVVPPPIGRLGFQLSDVLWAPSLFPGDQARSNELADSVLSRRSRRNDQSKDENESVVQTRRRGFGLELETVQLPPDAENDCFTHQQQFVQSVERARKWHLTRVSDDDDEDGIKLKRVNDLYDELLLWNVSHDLYVENAAPPTRLDLYQQIMTHIKDNQCDSNLSSDAEAISTLNELVLGGRVEIPAFLGDIPEQHIPTSQASPEYKSPLPPNELYHTFPPPQDGHDDATDSIRLVLDGVLKNEAASCRGVAVPTVSDIGQSGTSIHVHVNITNPSAWPREEVTKRGDVEATLSLLSVIFGWICFDRVIGCHFNMPNVWRDRSFAPMYVTGPEFSWNEVSWRHGHSTITPEQVTHVKLNNLQAWFAHVHSLMKNSNEEKKEQEPVSLFEAVFDHEALVNTISRWNSLNLLPLKPYGTIEFRRMHATLDADFVLSWTWFCVGFVEKFSQPSMFESYLYPFIGDVTSMEVGLERLAHAQNKATLEDLYEIMCQEDEAMPRSAFEKLIICKRY